MRLSACSPAHSLRPRCILGLRNETPACRARLWGWFGRAVRRLGRGRASARVSAVRTQAESPVFGPERADLGEPGAVWAKARTHVSLGEVPASRSQASRKARKKTGRGVSAPSPAVPASRTVSSVGGPLPACLRAVGRRPTVRWRRAHRHPSLLPGRGHSPGRAVPR